MKKLGFTLAEVLITLVIIGVIAAMTVPSLMNNTNGLEYRAAFKKAISSANQALRLSYTLDGTTAQDFDSSKDLVDGVFKARMTVMEEDGNDETNSLDFTTDDCNGTTFVTADGIMYCVNSNFAGSNDEDTSACDYAGENPCIGSGSEDDISGTEANMYIDVNGEKGPNTLTESANRPRDVYPAMIYAQTIVPWGAVAQQVMYDKKVSSSGSDSSSSSD